MTISNIFVTQIVFLILCIFFVLFPTQFILQSNTILGKLIAISIIILFTSIHYLYGLFICLIVIFYYQSDYIHNIIQSENSQTIEPMIEQRNPTMTSSSISEDIVTTSSKQFIDINDAYDTKKLPIQSESETIFRNQHCNADLELVYKNQIIQKNYIIPTIFPEIEFVEKNNCNPCDPSCPFSIKTSLEKKEWIGQSTRGKTSLEEAMDWAHSFFVNKNEPFSGVDLNVASFL
jgi:hypothetical protein